MRYLAGGLDVPSGTIYDTTVDRRIVIDTCVLVSALRSRRGASFRVISMVDSDRFGVCVSVPLVLEYEAVAKRHAPHLTLGLTEIDAVIDYVCRVATHHRIHYLWRPVLRDPNDDMVLELAVAANASDIVTFNLSDFTGAHRFGVCVLRPAEFLRQIGEIS